jgi:adenosylcobinamide-phosphate synthase
MKPFSPSKLTAAYAIDLALGDPPGMPHPVRLIGHVISSGERLCRPGKSTTADFMNGALLSVFTIASSWIAGWLTIHLARSLSPALGTAAEVTLAWTTLATGSLVSEARAVVRALESAQLEQARRLLSMIVGRDTGGLDESEIARAVIETVAEGLCDGVAAPLFYLVVGGVPLALAYKALNTLDSMIGHPEMPYTYFGRFAARSDDVANFIPARLTALAIVLAAGLHSASHCNAWRTWIHDGHKHPSPNAGQSESAMAGALSVRLGGINYYQGNPSAKPLLGKGNRIPAEADARRSIELARIASALVFAAALGFCTWKRRR